MSLRYFFIFHYDERICPIELEITYTMIQLSLLISRFTSSNDNEGCLKIKLYDKKDDFSFPIVNFPFPCSNIPAALAYGVYTSNWYDIHGLVFPIVISLIEDSCSQRRYQARSSKWWSLNFPSVNCTDANTSWLTVME